MRALPCVAPVSPKFPGLWGRGKADRSRRVSPALLERERNWAVDARPRSGRKAVGPRAAGGLGGQTLNLSMLAAPFFFRGLRPRVGMRPGLVETELSFAGLTALAQGGM